MSLCLTKDELIELTGHHQGARMSMWLDSNGFINKMGADGLPRVDRTHYREVMSGQRASARSKGPRLEGLKSA